MNLSEAERILGVKAGASAEEVRAAFSKRVKEDHPDRWGVSLREQKYASMGELKRARDKLLERAGVTPTAAKGCPICRGTGVQVIGFRRVPCVRGCPDD